MNRKKCLIVANTFQHSQKLEFYTSFKTDHTTFSYLDLTRGTARRRALVKLRISNHKLSNGNSNKIGRPRSGSPICLITSMITDRIGIRFDNFVIVIIMIEIGRYNQTTKDNCWFSHDVTKMQTKKLLILPRFYFHDALEQLKTNFHTNFRFKRILGFVIEYA